MSRLLSTATVLALIVSCVPPPMMLLAAPIVVHGANPRTGSTPPSPPTPSPPSAAGPRTIALNFENADIEMVIQAASEIVGFSYILAPDVHGEAEEVHVIRLQYADAGYVAGILNQLFAGERLARPPVIVADRRTNSLIIRARPSELETIGRLLGHD